MGEGYSMHVKIRNAYRREETTWKTLVQKGGLYLNASLKG
jgi:hypothetical protein